MDRLNKTRVTVTIPVSVKETLQKAAKLSGASLNQFLVRVAMAEAHQIIEAESSIVGSEREIQAIFNLFEDSY